MNRRTFIRISGIATSVAIIPWLTGCSNASEWTPILSVPETLGMFCGKEELVAIGEQYRHDFPDEKNESTLQNLLLTRDGKTVDPDTEDAVRAFVRDNIAHDFSSGDLAIVRGWVLAKTEARQLALYSILNS